MIDETFHLRRTGDGTLFAIEIGSRIHNKFWSFINHVGSKTNDYFRIRIDRPAKAISRGPRSQMARHWGHCTDIADQLATETKRYTKEMVDRSLRILAVREGLPTFYNEITDEVEPKHISDCSAEEYEIIERVKQRLADEAKLWLTEYDETVDPPVPYRSVAGRTRQEMIKLWGEPPQEAT